MAKRVRLAILRARHDAGTALISDAACIRLLVTDPQRRSVLDYWSDTTGGHLDFLGTTLFPWVSITLDAADTTRTTQMVKAYEATKALAPPENLDSFDGFVVLTLPGRVTVPNPLAGQPGQPPTVVVGVDGGAGSVAGKPTCALPVMDSDHTFMAHEVGHVLGFGHSYGVWNNGVDWDGKPPFDQGQVYGDPYDIMSSASFGTRNLDPTLSRYTSSPTFTGPAVPGWPNPGASRMGPAPALAHLHQWDPASVPERRVRHLDASRVPRTFQLQAAGSRGGRPQLVVVHPANEDELGRGRLYVEFRTNIGWDAGIDLAGSDLARRAVVVHALADATNDGVRCWYRGRIIVPIEVDSDLAVAGTQLVIRVLDHDLEEGWVSVEVARPAGRGIELTTRGFENTVGSNDERPMGTPCGDTLTWANWVTESSMQLRPSTYGYGGAGAPDAAPPIVRWRVGGKAITGRAGTVDVTVEDGSTFTVTYEHEPATAELWLASRGGERYDVEVVATATENDGTQPTTAVTRFAPGGYYSGFGGGDIAKLDGCMEKYLRQVRLRPHDLLVPPDHDPREHWHERINRIRIDALVDRLAPVHGSEAVALAALNAMRNNHVRQGGPAGAPIVDGSVR